jgi:DNA helicase HerA-like ATPase
MKEFFEEAAMQDHPLRILQEFLKQEKRFEQAKEYDKMRFVGYVLEISYDTVTIITSDPFKLAVGGVPRNSLLIMVPDSLLKDNSLPPHFTLLRVLDSAPTPLSKEVQQTYFELQKRSMPELDVFTQSELQWGALKTAVLGMFYPHLEKMGEVEFSGDLNNFVSAHKYRVYAPNDELLNLIINSTVPKENRFPIGKLRLTECRLSLPGKPHPNVTVYVSTKDFMGTRTALFGKTRLGKSNVVKLIAQSIIEATKETRNVGQLIFDINGEYANDNPQDNSLSLRSVYPDYCVVYALTQKPATQSKPLKLNFYEHPDRSHRILANLLETEGRTSIYVKAFIGAEIPSLESLKDITDHGKKKRAERRILMYWAVLKKAGFEVDESNLSRKLSFDPGYNKDFRKTIWQGQEPPPIDSLDKLVQEFERIADFIRDNPESPLLRSKGSGESLFDSDDKAILNFLKPSVGAGPTMIQRFRIYHDANAGDFIKEIIKLLDEGKTVILDLSNADPEVANYFAEELSVAVFIHQVYKFTNNRLGNHYIQLYFEEAHNLFPNNEDVTTIYSRLAKEGAKYHIGMVYSTQSPTTINKDLLAQTENFFVAHLSSKDDVNTLAKVNIEYESLKDDILRSKTVGYIRMLTRSHRFVIPVQARKFTPININKEGG